MMDSNWAYVHFRFGFGYGRKWKNDFRSVSSQTYDKIQL